MVHTIKKKKEIKHIFGVHKIETKSSSGEPLEVVVTENSIKAYRKEKPEIQVYTTEEKKIDEEPIKELEETMFKEPIMTIERFGKNDFNVDFEAGFQRGGIRGLSKKETFDWIKKIEMYHGEDIKNSPPFIEWIGLSKEHPIIKKFIKEGE